MLNIGKGEKTYYIVAEVVHIGIHTMDIKLTDNESWAKANKIIGKIKANSYEEAKNLFRVRNMI